MVAPGAAEYGPEGGTVAGMNEEEMRDHVEMLLHRMDDEDNKKKFTAGVAMALYIGDQSFLPEEMETHPAATLAGVLLRPKVSKDVCMTAVRALAMMGPHAAPHACGALTKMLGSSDFELKWETTIAIRAVGPGAAEGDSGIPEALARVLSEEEATTLRYETARALEALGPGAAPGAASSLAQALEEEDADIQNVSAKALAVMGPAAAFPSVIAALVKAIEGGPFELKRLAVDALAAMGAAAGETAPVLGKLLRPSPAGDPSLRKRAAEALGAMGRDLIRQEQLRLSQALGDPQEEVREAARATLQKANCKRALKGSMYLQDSETDEDAAPAPALSALGDESKAEMAALVALEVEKAKQTMRRGRRRSSRRDSRESLASAFSSFSVESEGSSSGGSRSRSNSVPESLVTP